MNPDSESRGLFLATRWSVVMQAGDDAGLALAQLCQTYWRPVYCCVRRHGRSPEDAQDLTQAFFAKLLRTESFADADPLKGGSAPGCCGHSNIF